MKNKKLQNYVTLSSTGTRYLRVAPAEEVEALDVAYRPPRVAEEAVATEGTAPNAIDAADGSEYAPGRAPATAEPIEAKKPRILVMARGKNARRLLQDCSEAGFEVWAATTQDRRFDTFLRAADGIVSLGDKYSDALFSNAYVVLQAAQDCHATTILLSDEALPLANVDGFLAHAKYRGMRVFRPASAEVPGIGWVLCTTERTVTGDEVWRECPSCGLKFDETSLGGRPFHLPFVRKVLPHDLYRAHQRHARRRELRGMGREGRRQRPRSASRAIRRRLPLSGRRPALTRACARAWAASPACAWPSA